MEVEKEKKSKPSQAALSPALVRPQKGLMRCLVVCRKGELIAGRTKQTEIKLNHLTKKRKRQKFAT